MKISYYPGCTLKTKARSLEDAAIALMKALGYELEELPRWNCCGAVHSLADDDLIHQVAPVRDLIRAKEQGSDKLVTLCSMCYNSLARANLIMGYDEEKRKTINDFMDEEIDYQGEVEVLHLLTFLSEVVGWDQIREKVKKPLQGMKVAPYYGCTLQRPREVAIEPPGQFGLMKQLIETLGGSYVSFNDCDRCCGSYQILGHPEAAGDVASIILKEAAKAGAEALVMSCPLCEYNLGKKQKGLLATHKLSDPMPTFYFTQLLALALGIDPDVLRLDLNNDEAVSLLKNKGLI
jgi:heterodisulfide reductase subunit B